MQRLKFFSLCILFSVVSSAYGQEIAPGFTHYVWTIDDGLPAGSVNGITITEDGSLWLSAGNGLARFNGLIQSEGEMFTLLSDINDQDFKPFYGKPIYKLNENEFVLISERKDSSLLWYHDQVFEIIELEGELIENPESRHVDDEGQFWFILDRKLTVFQNGKIETRNPSITVTDDDNLKLQVVSENEIWWLGSIEEKLYRLKDGIVKEINKEVGLSSDRVLAYRVARNGKAWILTPNGLELMENNKARLVLNNPPLGRLRFLTSSNEQQDSKERIVYTTVMQSEIIEYLIIEEELKGAPSELANFSEMEITGSYGGDWTQTRYNILYNDSLVFKSPTVIEESVVDKNGDLWIATHNRLYYLKKNRFGSYAPPNHDVVNVYSIIQDSENTLWVVKRMNGVKRGRNETFEDFEPNSELSNTRVYSVMEDSENNLWFGTDKGLYYWDRDSDIRKIDPLEGIELERVKGLYEDSKGTIWLAGLEHLISFSEDTGWRNYEMADNRTFTGGTAVQEDLDGRIWIISADLGLLYFDAEIDAIQTFEGNTLSPYGSIRSFYQDSDSTYWLGMNGTGVIKMRLNPDQSIDEITHYDRSNGMHGMVISSIIEDNYGRLWMASNSGLFWVSKSEMDRYENSEVDRIYSTVYSVNDGLPGTETNGGFQSSAEETNEGHILYPMMEGIGIVYPERIQYQKDDLYTRIIDISTSDSLYSSSRENVTLSNNERNLQFKYAAFNYELHPENIRYRYKLEGYDDDWVEVGDRQEAFYTNVPGGNYTFVVQAALFGYDWSENESELTVSIDYYFYETLWFKVTVVLFALILLFAGIRWRIRASELRATELSKLVDEQTEQLVAQAEQLKELDKAKSRFFANVSHEFRTPLSLIIGPLEELVRNPETSKEEGSSSKLEMAVRSSKRLLKLVNEVLDISKLESNTIKPTIRKFSMQDLLEQISLEFSSTAEINQVSFKKEFNGGDSILYADPDMMDKVFVNLLSNAFKFTPSGGEISISIEENEEEYLVTVKDTGTGIKEEELEHIFDRFYQTNELSTQRPVGTGIGLALVKELVELHKGDIWVESELGKGASFVVNLRKGKEHFDEDTIIDEPLFDPASFLKAKSTESTEDLKQPVKDESEEKSELDLPTILLIDDNEDIREYLRDHFSGAYNVLEAQDGKRGLEIATQELPDVIISDVMMPVMDGFTFTKQLRANKETDFIPVMLLTAKSDVVTGLETGVEDYIVKPFDVEEVKLRVKNLLRSRKKLMDHLIGKGTVFKVSELDVKSEDTVFLERVLKCIEEAFTDEHFGVVQLSHAMAMSRVTLHSKLKSAVSKSPSELIREFRLERARQLLSNKAGNVSEVAYSVGFKSVAQFSRAYKEQYNSTPREALEVSESRYGLFYLFRLI